MTVPHVTVSTGRWAWAEVDVDAITSNVEALLEIVAPADVWAVVKADGYGHGAVRSARAALAGGASGLAVALVQEGVALRAAGIEAPILVLTEQPSAQANELVAAELTPTVGSLAGAAAIDAAAPRGWRVHVKVDTGMHRAGVGHADAAELVKAIGAHHPRLAVEGIFTHLACADEVGSAATTVQLDRFDAVLGTLAAGGALPPVVHAANSAAALAVPGSRGSFVRAGIAIYGISPGPALDDRIAGLRPALSLHARVARVHRVDAGEHVSYGWRHGFDRATTVATLPIGYADGVPRRLGTLPGQGGADVLIGGRRHPIVGVVTMDQLMVDVGDAAVNVGDEAVLIGTQGDETIRAESWAERLGTIGYEIVCGISARVQRVER